MKRVRVLLNILPVLLAATLTGQGAAQPSAADGARKVVAESDVLSVTVPDVVQIRPGGSAELDIHLNINKPYHVMANPAGENLIPTTLSAGRTPFVLDVVYPEGRDFALAGSLETFPVYEDSAELSLTLTAPAEATAGLVEVPLVLEYQACDEGRCLRPTSLSLPLRVEVASAEQAVGAPSEPDGPKEGISSTRPGEPEPSTEEATIALRLQEAFEKGWYWVAGLVFLLGLGLNLTPCVFPLLPITMGFFAAQGQQRASRTFPLALVYVLSLAAVFTVLGVAAALAGTALGVALQSVYGRLAIAAIMLALAASLFGAFEIRLPTGFLSRFQGKGGFAGAVIMGATVGLVAAPCSGPVLAALAQFVASAQSVVLGAAIFFALALGLGLPYLVLGMFTGLINRIPRGGGYLLWFRRLLAFPVLALVIYYLTLDEPWLSSWLYAALALVAAVYLGIFEGWSRQPWSRRFVVARVATAMGASALGVWVLATDALPPAKSGATPAGAGIVWQPFREGALREASGSGTPAVVYFTADWCVYCRDMEATTFRDANVTRAAEGVRLLKVDISRGNPEGEAGDLARQYVRVGPPVLVFYDRTGQPVAQQVGAINSARLLKLLEETKSK